MDVRSAPLRNWSGSITYAASAVHRPTSVAGLQSVVSRARRVRALGSRHSFSDVADSDAELVRLDGLPRVLEVDSTAGTVTVDAGATYGEVAAGLHAAGRALPSMGSLPHISVAGACATGTHGSGDSNQVLAASVVGLEMVGADGDLVHLSRDTHPEQLDGVVLSLGALGVVTRVTLETVPGFDITQEVRERLPPAALLADVGAVLSAGYSVSVFTDWGDPLDARAWLKRRTDEPPLPPDWFGGVVADGPRHPLPGMPTHHATEQLGTAGPWHERLPHFRMEYTPSNGDELQSEYMVPREHAAGALSALAGLSSRLGPVLQVGELRSIAADDLWLSTAYQRDSLAIHFTWVPDMAAVAPVVDAVEAALAPFEPRPHWGKVFRVPADVVASRYPRLPDVVSLRDALDPGRCFANAFVDRYLGS